MLAAAECPVHDPGPGHTEAGRRRRTADRRQGDAPRKRNRTDTDTAGTEADVNAHAHEGQHAGHREGGGHGHGHDAAHGHGGGEPDWVALADMLEEQAEIRSPFAEQAAGWLRALADGDGSADGDAGEGSAVRRLLDVGSGPGVVTTLLAQAFPQAEAVAVDGEPALLQRARERAERHGTGDRLRTQEARLPDDFGSLPAADLIWTSHAVHHLGDQQAALDGLARLLRPGGLLAVVERGLELRCLPRDIGLGRPGLQARIDAALEDAYTEMRAELPGHVATVEDWPAMLTGAGLDHAGTRSFLTDRPAPVEPAVRRHLRTQVARARERLADRLDAEDVRTLDALLDDASPEGLLRRPDVFYLSATTVHVGRRPADGGR